MNDKYDVFEILPYGSCVWRASATGTENVLEMLKAVGKQTSNECFATDLRTREIIGRVNKIRYTSQINANGDSPLQLKSACPPTPREEH